MILRNAVIGVDTGGTFTDAVLLVPGAAPRVAKAATTPGNLAAGVLEAIGNLARQADVDVPTLLAATDSFRHATTVATNALITRRGATVGLITTTGFEDTPFIMRAIGRIDGLSPEVVRHWTAVTKPDPLLPRERVVGVRERIDAYGDVVVPLSVPDVLSAAADLVEGHGCDAIAISFLHAWRNPTHEDEAAELVASEYDDVYVTRSTSISQEAGEYARTNTAIVDAFVGPLVVEYLDDLERRLRSSGFAGRFLVVQGHGACADSGQSLPVGSLHSGPAAGMAAALFLADAMGDNLVVTADMGGTSLDVGVIDDGVLSFSEEPIVERFRILAPIVDVESIGAGGGTIAYVDSVSRRLVVGPDSAGADPGPVSYGRGGVQPTVTDANVALGRLDPEAFLGGEADLDRASAEAAIDSQLGVRLDLDTTSTATGILRIIDAKMADLIRARLAKRGRHPGDVALYSFGGAAGLHAVALAEELGIGIVRVFDTSSVFSAFGAAIADVTYSRVQSCSIMIGGSSSEDLLSLLDGMLRDLSTLHHQSVRVHLGIRFARQTLGVDVEFPFEDLAAKHLDPRILRDMFIQRYRDIYGEGAGGHRDDVGEEIYRVRVDVVAERGSGGSSEAPAVTGSLVSMAPRAVHHGSWESINAYRWETRGMSHSGAGIESAAPGPCVIEANLTTLWVPAGWQARADVHASLLLERRGSLPSRTTL